MRDELKSLIALQLVDLRLLEIRAQLAAFPKKIAELDARVAAAKAAIAKEKDALLTSLKERKTFEMDVEQWKTKVKKYKDQLSEIRSNDAYKALQHEIQMAEEQIAAAEDRLLERMMSGEKYDAGVKAAEKALVEVEAVVKLDRQKVDAEKSEVDTKRVAAEAERAVAVSAVSEDMLEHYQRIAARYHGVALSEVQVDQTCTMCRVRVRPHVFQELSNPVSQELFHCESCARILYHLQPVTVAASAAAVQSNQA
ncbi:MAG: hypothetical protein HY046_00210 [Acidobacteria bacterium]|nr:hypothetical protein [Acidobacteriota bacterium]